MAEEFVKKIIERHQERGIYEISEMTQDALDDCKDLAKAVLRALLSKADEALVKDKRERLKDGIKVKTKGVPREIYTELGWLEYKRTYFTGAKGNVFLLDLVMGIKPYERVDAGVSASMANQSAIESFGKSAEHAAHGDLSRQTAWNKAMGIGQVALVPKRVKDTPDVLHIFADEDHVNLKDGGSAIVPMIVISSGKSHLSKDRNELADRLVICRYGIKARKLWEYAYATCEATFDMSKVLKVIIYGDGAKWIAQSKESFPYAEHVLDSYHYEKRMKGILAGEICVRYSGRIRKAVKDNDLEAFKTAIADMRLTVKSEMPEGKYRDRRLSKVNEDSCYILRFWEAIQNIKDKDSIGSCTEGLVSHILSERFSRNPMGWSKQGLSQMTAIRAYTQNGELVKTTDVAKRKYHRGEARKMDIEISKYERLVRETQAEYLAKAKDWRLFERKHPVQTSPSGTKVLLDAMGRIDKAA
jgi:hypothetical protein